MIVESKSFIDIIRGKLIRWCDRQLCYHDWEEIDRKYYIDYSCIRVRKITFKCKKCGKRRVEKKCR